MSWIRGNGSLAIPARRRRLGPAMLAQYSERINPSLNSWVADKAISFRNISVYKILRDLPEASFSSILQHTVVTPDTPLANTARLAAYDGDHAQGGPPRGISQLARAIGRASSDRTYPGGLPRFDRTSSQSPAERTTFILVPLLICEITREADDGPSYTDVAWIAS